MTRATRSWSMVHRLVLSLLAIVLATACLQIGVTYQSILRESDEVFDYQLKQTAQVLAAALPAGAMPSLGGQGDTDDLDLIIRERDAGGEIRTNAAGVFAERLSAGFSEIATRLGALRAYTITKNGREVSVGQLLDARRDMAREVAFATLWPIGLLAIASLILLFIVLRAALHPITRLQEQVRRREPTSLAPLEDPGLPRELRPLLQATNGLVAQLNSVLDHQRRFLADAAHELRTPISAIRLQNTLVGKADTEEERQRSLATQETGIRRASLLVDQLLNLSRIEAADAPVQAVEFDVAAELRSLIAMHEPQATSKNITFALSTTSTKVIGDPALASAVFGNLIGNAVHHCPAGSHVIVEVVQGNDHPIVNIFDDGPGIPDHQIAAVLQPFHRGDSTGTPGSGLGLAIVQAACHRAGWQLTLGTSPQGGLGAIVKLKLNKQSP